MPIAAKALAGKCLQIRLLGELQLCRAGAPLALPASRKTRALLAYLAVSAKRQLRSELCTLFWEDAADPRSSLRWSLTQLRHALGEQDSEMIHADRDAVELRGAMAISDLARLAPLTRGGLAGASRAVLLEAGALFRGEFLEGLELPSCYAYHEWCMAEREAASRSHELILEALVAAPCDGPRQALVHARALAAHNPLNEHGHIALMKALGALGRRRDALAQYRQCCRIFERELGLAPPAALEAARASLGSAREAGSDDGGAGLVESDSGEIASRERAPLIGRAEEVAQLARSVELAVSRKGSEVVLVTGAPGIGKSRLLDELERCIQAVGGRCLRGRAFEAEMLRPFGFWIDALRGLSEGDLPPAIHAALVPLMRAGAGEVVAGDRDSLFDAVANGLSNLSGAGPVAVLVDDLHWIEASSAALLHYAMRELAEKPVLFALGGRAGELEDNAAAQRLLAALAKSRRLRRIALLPLLDDEARALVASVAQDVDAAPIVARAQGNPLILLELARSYDAAGASSGLLEHILDTRLARLSPDAGELLDWASAFGQVFPLEGLVAAHGDEPGAAGRRLAELERHALIRAAGDTSYEFSHDLIQQAAYSRISQPRRRLIHKSIASVLSREMAVRPEICSELAYHAALGGQYELATRASVAAGEHGLRVYANREAVETARRGLRHAARIPAKSVRAGLEMALLRIQVLASSGQSLSRLRPGASEITAVIDAARSARLHTEVAQGYYLLSVVYQEAGRLDAAQQATLQAAKAAKMSDALGRVRQLANSARCLVELGREIPRARELLAEARSLAEAAGVHEIEVRWCMGLLHNWDGHLDLAAREIDAAIELATEAEDWWRQCKCLAWVAIIDLERQLPKQAIVRATALKLAASQLGEAADEPLAQAIEALARQMSGEETEQLGAAIEKLRLADDKSRLAYVLNLAAASRLELRQFNAAGAIAADALVMAEAIGDANESILAHATLAQVAAAMGDSGRTKAALEKLRPVIETPDAFSARAVQAVNAVCAATAGAGPVSAANSGRAQ